MSSGGFERKPGVSTLVQGVVQRREAGVAPGKRTLTEQLGSEPPVAVQRRATDATDDTPEAVHTAADQGTAGSSTRLPHADQIQRAFGHHDISGIQAHTDGAAAASAGAMGARAFATGNHVAFAGTPDLHTAAHEAAHVVQQRGVVQLKGGVGEEGDAYERHANAVADRVVAGGSAQDLLDQHAPGGGTGGGSTVARRPVQHFKDFAAPGSKDSKGGTHWANPTPLRVAEDGTAAIAQARLSGSKEMYVLDGRLAGINADLARVHAPLRLTKDAGSVTGAAPGDLEKGAHTLDRVKPVDAADPKVDKTIPDDCGNAARTVTGASAEGKGLHAEYNDKAGNNAHTANTDPEMMKYEIMVNHFGDKMPHVKTILADVAAAISAHSAVSKAIEPHVADLNTLRKALDDAETAAKAVLGEFNALKAAHDAKIAAVAAGAPDKAAQIKALDDALAAAKAKLAPRIAAARTAYMDADTKYKAFLTKDVGGKKLIDVLKQYFDTKKLRDDLISEIMGPYLGLSALAQDTFDQKTGIDRFANPAVGEAYTISSGGKDKPGKSTWNFHWAGVIFKSTTGSDNITMENYAGNATSEWRLQMYGVPTKDNARAGQTFHEQHRDAHGQHGETPTTMSTEKI